MQDHCQTPDLLKSGTQSWCYGYTVPHKSTGTHQNDHWIKVYGVGGDVKLFMHITKFQKRDLLRWYGKLYVALSIASEWVKIFNNLKSKLYTQMMK